MDISYLTAEAKPLIFRKKLWDARLQYHEKEVSIAYGEGFTPTPYFIEAVDYWRRAKDLQDMNLGLRPRVPVGDKLQEMIPIYDTVERRYAGFSNVLEQLWYGPKAPKLAANKARNFGGWFLDRPWDGSDEEWMYICLVHRVTGSGASFEHDHGWRNSVVVDAAELPAAGRARYLLEHRHRPIFTSIGNQIPPFNKKTVAEARNAGHEYLGLVAPKLVEKMHSLLKIYPMKIQQAVDVALKIQRDLGHKQFKFVLTAWVMDIAEYLPHLVDPNSDCYHGKNAQESLRVCLRPRVKMKQQEFFDRGTRLFCDLTGTKPMDVEDASPGCDLIRWLENYVPKKGFDHVRDKKIFNSSSLRYPHGRQPA